MTAEVVQFPKFNVRQRLVFADLRQRLGRFAISDSAMQVWPDVVQQIMARVIVLQASRGPAGYTLYVAISEQFDRVDVDAARPDPPPFYDWLTDEGPPRALRIG